MELSFEEKELIESIRNYCNSYPKAIRNYWSMRKTSSTE